MAWQGISWYNNTKEVNATRHHNILTNVDPIPQ